MKQIINTQIDSNFNIDELTNNSNTGILDTLIDKYRTAIKAEYDDNRIRGTDYANVFATGLNQIIEIGQRYASDKLRFSLELEKHNLELQILEANLLKIATDTAVATKQGGLLDAQILETMSKVNQLNAETATKLPAEVDAIYANIDLSKQELALKKLQIPLLEEELNLKKNQVTIALEQLKQTRYELENKLPAEVEMLNCQARLYCQKVYTEQAQISGDVAQEGSVIWHQNQLVKEQAKTYERDAIQKTAKLLIDTWSVRYSTDPNSADAFSVHKLNDNTIAKAVDKLGEDIGVNF